MGIKSSIQMEFGEKSQDDFSLSIQRDNTNKDCASHWHDCFELIYVRYGQRGLTIANSQHILREGEIAVIPPHILHGTNNPEHTRFDTIVFGYTEQLIYTPDISFSNMKYLSLFYNVKQPEFYIISGDGDDATRLRNLLSACAEEVDRDSPIRELKLRAYILEIHSIIYTHASSNQKPSGSPRYLEQAQIYIDEHLESDISPYEVASELHISYSHLSRLFGQQLAMSISEYICRARLNMAERLLASDPELSVTECASRVGFNNVSYFISKFRRYKGCSPGEFRRSEMNLF